VPLFAPLRGLRVRPDRAAEVAALPYDVMSRAEAIAMAAGRPHSFLHVSRPDIDLPEGADPDGPEALARAADALARLEAEGLLVRDEAPAFHAYRLSGTVAGQQVGQTGIVGLADVAAYEAGRIARHERTRPAKQAGRAAHIEALGAQTGPAFLLHPPAPAIRALLARLTAAPPETDLVGPGGIRHQLWPIADPDTIDALVAALEALPRLYIADGHHRSAAAAMVHARLGSAASGGFLAVAFPADEVTLLPYHRLVRAPEGLTAEAFVAAASGAFAVEAADGPVTPAAPGRFGLYCAGRWWRLAVRPEAGAPEGEDPAEQLDVAVLQRLLLEPVLGITDPRTDPRIDFVGGVRPAADLERAVDRDRWTAAITLHPTTVTDLVGVADAGGIMPPKSTWFEPKLLDGLVSHVLD
jgi:uncharacterized protein (DUF1015 family)